MEEIKMLSVKEILSESLKKAITIEIMGNLPEWFSPPEDIPVKAEFYPILLGCGFLHHRL